MYPRLAPNEICALAIQQICGRNPYIPEQKSQNMPLHVSKIDHFDVIQPGVVPRNIPEFLINKEISASLSGL